MPSPFADLFLTADPASVERLRAHVDEVLAALAGAPPDRPRSALDPEALTALAGAVVASPVDADLLATVLAHGVHPSHPRTAAHLHPPALLAAAAAELAIAATNQSLDSHDQAPMATAVELALTGWLSATVGLPSGATGVLTAGGTASNLLGLTLARAAHARRTGHDVAAEGLPATARRWRILVSAGAHFSLAQAAAVLGLGHRAVVPVPTDDGGRMDPVALDTAVAALRRSGDEVMAVVGTAGTTDLGAVDPLPALADRAAAAGAWFHVDAAVGSALALSDRHRALVAGIERADSVTADLHKLWWQPFAASALLVRDPGAFAAVREESDYLDRDEDVAQGVTNLVGRSLDTSRRFDALKVVVALAHVGPERLGAMVDHVIDLAQVAAVEVGHTPDLVLVAPPETVTCVFRWTGAGDDGADRAMTAAARHLFATGDAVVGRTRVDGRVALKLTFVNPVATAADVRDLVRLVAEACRRGSLEVP